MDTEKELQSFCTNIRFLRKTYHLSKRSMAMLIGISAKELSFLEAGIVTDNVTTHTLQRLQHVFMLPMGAFFSNLANEKTGEA